MKLESTISKTFNHKGDNSEIGPKKKGNVTFCIVNYNGENYLNETLRSVFSHKHEDDEILLIDNFSTDRSILIVEDRFPEVKIVKLKNNLGPGAARNVGFVRASNEMICFLDNDVSLTKNCMKYLLNELETNPSAVAAMPQVLFAHNHNIVQYDGASAHYIGLMIVHNENVHIDSTNSETKKIGSIITACFLLNRAKWKIGKPFDESFFIYLEDHDFGLKAKVNNYEILSVPKAKVIHREGTAGLSLRRQGKYSKERVFSLIRNRWQIILKYYSAKTILIIMPILLIYEFLQLIIAFKKGWIREWLRSVLWVIFNIRSIFRKRRLLQKTRVLNDKAILDSGPLPFTNYLTQGRIENIGKKYFDFIVISFWKHINKII